MNLKRFFEKTYAAHAHIISAPKTVITVVITLLNKYLEAGMLVLEERLNSDIKLSRVGLRTKNLGGYAISSSIGLKAFEIIKTIGSAIITQIGTR